MLSTPNFQALMDLCRANEEAPGFDLERWFTFGRSCGTIGCLYGNWLLAKGPICASDVVEVDYRSAASEFGITEAESVFLLAPRNIAHGRFGQQWISGDPCFTHGERRNADDVHAAVRRVRKLIYWKLKRREFMYDESGRVRESARRMEGDRRFDRQVAEAVA